MNAPTHENLIAVDEKLAAALCRPNPAQDWPSISELLEQRRRMAEAERKRTKRRKTEPEPSSYKDMIRLVEALLREFKSSVIENCPDDHTRHLLLADAHKRMSHLLMDD